MLPVDMLASAAWRTLPHPARTVLTVLAAQYSGRGNGSITLTRRTARDYGITDPHMLYRALDELLARGLAVRTRHGTHIPPRSAMYALGWRAIDDPLPHDAHDARATVAPGDEWRTWTSTIDRPHWAASRRAPRWGRATHTDGDAPPIHRDMDGHAPPMDARSPVARATPSHISARGAR